MLGRGGRIVNLRKWQNMPVKLEYVETDTERVILQYDTSVDQVQMLLDLFGRLASDDPPADLRLEELDGCRGVNGCSLELRRSSVDHGIHAIPHHHGRYACELDQSGWEHAQGMLRPFLDGHRGVHQYLVNVGGIEWIISTHARPGW
jgi:hypothetical protein